MKIYAIEFKRKNHDNWIELRLKSILNRKKLTDVWKEGGIEKNFEYAMLTDEIYKTWSGMEYEDFRAHDEGGYEYRIIERDFKMNVTLTNTKIDDKIEI